MILYLDTSSLVKLYVEEDASREIHALVGSTEITATSIVAYPEARAAFARRFREQAYNARQYDRIKRCFDEDRDRFFVMNVTEDVAKMAGDLSEMFSLRGFDSIHLASALTLRNGLGSPVIWSSADDALEKAAAAAGLEVNTQ